VKKGQNNLVKGNIALLSYSPGGSTSTRHVVCPGGFIWNPFLRGLDWIEQCFMSPPTQYRGFYRSKNPTNSIKVLKEQIVHRQIKHIKSRHEHKTQKIP